MQRTLPLILAILSMTPWLAQASPLTVVPGKSLVQFNSKAPFETVIGKTIHLKGQIEIDPKNPWGTKGTLTLDPATLQTGNRLRDKQMRNQFLETSKYPAIEFELDRVLSGPRSLREADENRFAVEGTFRLHGVKRKETFDVGVMWESKNNLRLKTSFPIVLADYNIERPKFLFMRLAEKVLVTVDISLARQE